MQHCVVSVDDADVLRTYVFSHIWFHEVQYCPQLWVGRYSSRSGPGPNLDAWQQTDQALQLPAGAQYADQA